MVPDWGHAPAEMPNHCPLFDSLPTPNAYQMTHVGIPILLEDGSGGGPTTPTLHFNDVTDVQNA